MGDCYLDAMWFPDSAELGIEHSRFKAPALFPIVGSNVVLCEAKLRLTPELIGQALVYGVFARNAGAQVMRTVIFAREGKPAFVAAAQTLGLEVALPTHL